MARHVHHVQQVNTNRVIPHVRLVQIKLGIVPNARRKMISAQHARNVQMDMRYRVEHHVFYVKQEHIHLQKDQDAVIVLHIHILIFREQLNVKLVQQRMIHPKELDK